MRGLGPTGEADVLPWYLRKYLERSPVLRAISVVDKFSFTHLTWHLACDAGQGQRHRAAIRIRETPAVVEGRQPWKQAD